MSSQSDALERDGAPLLTRQSEFRAASYNPDDRTITVSLGTGAPVQRWDYATGEAYTEVLSLDPSHVNLSRMNGGAPLLESHLQHDVRAVVGRWVKGSVRVENGELVGQVRLSKAARHADTVADIVDGILADTSVGYVVRQWQIDRDADTGKETRTAIDWEPYEGSIVPIPADPTGGVRSQAQAQAEPAPEVPAAAEAHPDGRAETEESMDTQKNEEAVVAALEEGRRAEAERQKGIRELLPKAGLVEADVRDLLDDPKCSVSDAAVRMWDIKASRANDEQVRVQVVGDAGDHSMRAMEGAIEAKAGGALPEYAKSMRGKSVLDLAREYLRLRGIHTEGRSAREVCDMALRAPAGHTTSDFTSIFSNVLNKKLQAAYQLSSDYTWWRDIATRQDFSDDRARRIVSASGLGVLPTVTEGGEYQGLTQYDHYEEITPVKKGGEFRMTLEMMVRDDLSAFNRQALEFAKSCQYTEHTLALAALTANMSDGTEVCTVAHGNLSTNGGNPTVARIAELDAFLRAQTDGNGHVVGKGGNIGLFDVADKVTVEQMYSDRATYTTLTDIPTVPLSRENRRYVPGMSTMFFLLTGDPMAMEYGWVAEDGGPVVLKYPDYNTDSVLFHGRDWFGIGVVNHRDFAKNPGA